MYCRNFKIVLYSNTHSHSALVFIPKILHFIFLVTVAMLMVACEGNRIARGYILDRNSFRPLDSVQCKVLETGKSVFTDSTGYYDIGGPFGDCVFECKDMTVEYSKTGYLKRTILNPGQDSLYLEKK